MRITLNWTRFDDDWQSAQAEAPANAGNISPAVVSAKVDGKKRTFYRRNWSTEYYAVEPVEVKIIKGGK